ncbi:site-specific integrase [Corynebacterium sanguinis]|uniref:site-specific integrase n=1 Tax=Corynebacterium sanguinis TaxID=2594913 RepID=UPI0021A579C6|nr:site-specific integrase [Corynebacterium sanguinis]MCT1491320.1 site-specific integrase [Corynebacterium sanguinis]MCT2246761.1 site-specific integrase [Corynebacterium sanguinis]
MASIKRYKTARGTAWRVQYRSPDGKSRTKQGFRTKDEAQKWADSNAASMHQGAWIDPNAGNTTISALHAAWWATLTSNKPNYRRQLDGAWRYHVEPVWGGRKISTIRQSEIQAWVGTIEKHRPGRGADGKPGTAPSATLVANCHAVLKQILDVAVSDELLRRNPAIGVKLPKKPGPVKVYLTQKQLNALVTECGERGDIIAVLGTVGIRWGELAGLRVRDVNVLRRRLNISCTVARDDDGEWVEMEPKSWEQRTVAVPASIMGLIERAMVGKAPDDLLWERPSGGFLRPLGHTSFFHHAVRRCVADGRVPGSLTPHGLRHVAAGLMVASGATVKAVQKQLGHKSAMLTLDVYADLFDGDLDEVADRMDEGLRGMSWDCRANA